jgi:serine/threonine protein kinase
MPAPATVEQFLELVRKSGLAEEKALAEQVACLRADPSLPNNPSQWARALIRGGLLSRFQAEQILRGKSRGFTLAGKYRLLELLGTGGMGSVYLCEHLTMRRQVALKVLPLQYAQDPSYVERFYLEARAVAALDHANIVRAHDIDHDGPLHFLVMEFVDGSSLQEIVSKFGPLEFNRAAHYMSQAAAGLQHAHESGVVHRDIKPGNVLVDRAGTVKILDMGLARFFRDDDSPSKRYGETVLGTSDYLAPEQTLDSNVDIRADIYSLGATFYFCLTGQTLFGDGTTAQKLIWQQTRQPRPLRSLRPDVPEDLAVLIEHKMLAKDLAERFQSPTEICQALAPWTSAPLPPPPEEQMPRLSPVVCKEGRPGPSSSSSQVRLVSGSGRSWTVSGTTVIRPADASSVATGSRPTTFHADSSMDTPVNLQRPVLPEKCPAAMETAPIKKRGTRSRPKVVPAKKVAAARTPAPSKVGGHPARHKFWPLWATLALVAVLGISGAWWVINAGKSAAAEKATPKTHEQD